MEGRAEAREMRMRARLVDAVKEKVSRWEKEMTEISETLEKVFADDATDQVKKYKEEVGRLLQHSDEIQEPIKNVKNKAASTSCTSSCSSQVSMDDLWKQTMYVEIRDAKPLSSDASSSQARVKEILAKHLQRSANTSRSSSSQARIKEIRKLTKLLRSRDANTTSSSQANKNAQIKNQAPKK